MSDSYVVVCGATGNQGGAVVEALSRRGRFRVRALVRDPRKAAALANRGVELVTGDLVDTESLVRAFSSAAGVFGVTQPWSSDYRKADVENELIQGRSLVEASSRAQINLVLSTVLLVDLKPTGIPHVDSKPPLPSRRGKPNRIVFPALRRRVLRLLDTLAKIPQAMACLTPVL